MKKVFTLCLLFVSIASSSQENVPGTLAYGLANKIPHGEQVIVEQLADTVVVTGNCWGGKMKLDTIPANKPVNNGFICKVGGVKVQNIDTSKKATTGYICRATNLTTGNGQPLFVIDGVLKKDLSLDDLKPADIDSIWVLKGAVAQAIYGSDAYNGALIITTKKTRRFIIKDLADGSPVPGATVNFYARTPREYDRFYFAADSKGVLNTESLTKNKDYEVIVSSVGYETKRQVFTVDTTKEMQIFLEKKVITCSEVVINVPTPSRVIRCYFLWGTPLKGEEVVKSQPAPTLMHVFPNPVQRGASLNLQFDNTDGKEKIIRVLSLDGRVLLQQSYPANEGKNILRLPVDARWSAGTYLAQLLYENGQVIASEKIIVQ